MFLSGGSRLSVGIFRADYHSDILVAGAGDLEYGEEVFSAFPLAGAFACLVILPLCYGVYAQSVCDGARRPGQNVECGEADLADSFSDQ